MRFSCGDHSFCWSKCFIIMRRACVVSGQNAVTYLVLVAEASYSTIGVYCCSWKHSKYILIAILSHWNVPFWKWKESSFFMFLYCVLLLAVFLVLFHLSPWPLTQLALVGEKRRSDILPKKIVVYCNVNRLLLQMTLLFWELLIMQHLLEYYEPKRSENMIVCFTVLIFK